MSTEKIEKLCKAVQEMERVTSTLLDEEKGCPWDKEQTPHSLSEYTIEECFEMVDALRKNDIADVCDEMGDLVFGIMLIAKKYEQAGHFDFSDCLNNAVAKMERRHPHVFNEAEVNPDKDMQALHATWEAIKKEEKAKKSEEKKGVLSSIPCDLPSLTKAYRINAKVANVGFTWDDEEEVERQVEAEWLELLDAKASGDTDAITHELGDILFALTEMGRRAGVKASYAVEMTNNRFIKRFEAMEQIAKERGLDFSQLSLDDKDELWEEVKGKEASK